MDTVFGAKVHPMMLPFYEEIEIEEGKWVAVAPDACFWYNEDKVDGYERSFI